MTYTPYYPTGWEDDPSTDTPITAAALNNIEDGLTAAIPSATATTAHALVWDGSAWVGDSIRDARIASDAAISISKLAGYPSDSSMVLLGDGTWGAAGAPGYGTSLPGSPTDGQEYILVDSLTNPTYQWRFRYNAGSSSSYKWEFIGGASKGVFVGAAESVSSTTAAWVNLTTGGPSFTLPYAGDWEFACHTAGTGPASGATTNQFGIANGDTTPLYFVGTVAPSASYLFNMAFNAVLTSLAAASAMKLRYWSNGAASFNNRGLIVRPVRIG